MHPHEQVPPDIVALFTALERAGRRRPLVAIELPPTLWWDTLGTLQNVVRSLKGNRDPGTNALKDALAQVAREIEIELGEADLGLVEHCRRGWTRPLTTNH